MKATVTAGALAAASGWIARIIPSRPPVPILGGIVIDATSDTDRDELELSAFDYEIAGRTRLGEGVVSVDEPERIVVPGRLLAAVSKAIGSGQQLVTLAVEGGKLAVQAGPRARWSMPLLKAEDYPRIPDQAPVIGEIAPDALIAAVERVVEAAATDPGVQSLTGVAVNTDGEPFTLVATDRFRLAICETAWTAAGDGVAQLLAPVSLMRFAAGAVTGAQGAVEVRSDGKVLGFSTDDVSVSGRLLAAEYPRWRQLDLTPDTLKAKFRTTVVIETAALKAAVSRASVMIDRDKPHLVLGFTADEVSVTASGEDTGDAAHEAPVTSHEGDAIAVQVSDEYLRDALAASGEASVRLDVGQGRVLLRPCDAEGVVAPGYRHTVMTLRFAGGEAVKEL